jgi:hypothetical protein
MGPSVPYPTEKPSIRLDQELLDHLSLSRRIPVVGICRVVKGFGTAAILRAAIRPVRNQEFRESRCTSIRSAPTPEPVLEPIPHIERHFVA